MARPVDADPILAYPDAIHVFGKHNMDLAFMAEGAGLGCNTIVVAPSDAGASPRPAGSKTVRVIFKRYGYRRAVTADFGHLGLCREACAALGRAGRSVPRERQNGERKTRARTHRFSPSYQGFGREWDGRGLHREVKAGLAWRSPAQAAARRRAGAGGGGTDHGEDSDAIPNSCHLNSSVDYPSPPRGNLPLLILAKTGEKAVGSFVSHAVNQPRLQE
jgi:hypothetical protein